MQVALSARIEVIWPAAGGQKHPGVAELPHRPLAQLVRIEGPRLGFIPRGAAHSRGIFDPFGGRDGAEQPPPRDGRQQARDDLLFIQIDPD